jgi:polyphosphate:AMP phosphotransferase
VFESAELGRTIDKATWAKEVPALREALLHAQYDALDLAAFPIVVVVGGVDGAGKGETVNRLTAWMDPRHVRTHGVGEPTEEERERPPMWRFWRRLPPKGTTGVFIGSWYTEPIVAKTLGRMGDAAFDLRMDEIVAFEKMLTDEGALLLKFWFHVSKKAQKERLKELAAHKRTRWRVTDAEWERFRRYDDFRRVSTRALRETSRNEALWTVVEGTDARYRELTVGRALLAAIRARVAQTRAAAGKAPEPATGAPPGVASSDGAAIAKRLNLRARLEDDEYRRRLDEAQARLALLVRRRRFARTSLVAVFEGPDAAGKGGAIRRIASALEAQQVQVVPVGAPTEEERAQPYLWRFWRHLPPRGRVVVFDRSWYGRVLVERVEGYARASEWRRAYAEINDFEEQLARHGTVLAKFWLQVGKAEQLRRFQEREDVAYKRYKLTPEDWRNRKRWAAYEQAMADMVDRTSTEIAPWTLVPANDKKYARVTVLEALCERIEDAIG